MSNLKKAAVAVGILAGAFVVLIAAMVAFDLGGRAMFPERWKELDAKVEWLLSRIVNKSPTAIRLGKIGFQAVRDMTLNQAYEFGQLMLPTMAQTEDCKEGFAAFQQKRKPNWPGK